MFERFEEEAKNTVVFARTEAKRLGSLEIAPEHILLALLNDAKIARRILKDAPIDEMRNELSVSLRNSGESVVNDKFSLSDDAQKVLCMAAEEARRLNEDRICNEHLLLGILRLDACEASNLLKRKGVNITGARSIIADLRSQIPPSKNSGSFWHFRLKSLFSKQDEEAALLRRIARLVKSGRGRKALGLIDAYLDEQAEDNADRVRKFAPQAAAIARAIKDVSLARKYYEMALKDSSENVPSLYGMADVLEAQGDFQTAKEYAVRCYRLALTSEDRLNQGFIDLLEKRFPNLKASR